MTKKNSAPGSTFLVTSALPYANGDIHLGHLLEAVQTDVFVRFQKLRGTARCTYAPTIRTALRYKSSHETGDHAARVGGRNLQRHKSDYAGFNIGFDIFYTTDSPENRFYAELIYKGLRDKRLVEEKEISQYYCETDGRFLPDRFIKGTCPICSAVEQYGDVCEVCGSTYDPTDLKSPVCITCGKPPVLKKTTHLFCQALGTSGFSEHVCQVRRLGR